MTDHASRPHVPFVVIGLLVALSAGLQAFRDRLAPTRPDPVPMLWLQSPELARRMTLTFDDIAADLYWIRSIVHYGSERRATAGPGRFALLYPLLDMTTSFDPNFDVAVRLGAIFLSEGHPGGPGRPDQAITLLEKGLAHDPGRWQYVHDIAFVQYWWLKDYKSAAAQFDKASRMPGAPAWLKTMAGVTLLQGGDRAAARTMWSELYASADADWIRQAAEYRLAQLRALDDIDGLTGLIGQVRARTGHVPRTWAALIGPGMLGGEPLDPTGVPYALGSDGTVGLGSSSTLRPLPDLKAHQ